MAAARPFICRYTQDLTVGLRLELGIWLDGSVRVNLLGASTLPIERHAGVLAGEALVLARRCSAAKVPYHVGLRLSRGNTSTEIYVMRVGCPDGKSVAAFCALAGSRAPERLAMVGTSSSGQRRYYVVEQPRPELFGVSSARCVQVDASQLCQLDERGNERNRYLDLRPFSDDLLPAAWRKIQLIQGAFPQLGSQLRYGILARRDREACGFYYPIAGDAVNAFLTT